MGVILIVLQRFDMGKLKVYYGWARIGNVRKKRTLSVMFENEMQGCRSERGQRWDTWMYLVSTSLPELKRFIPVKYRKHLKKK